MSSHPRIPLLSDGQIIDGMDPMAVIQELNRKNRQLDEALRLERNKTGQIEAGLRELRRATLPFYRVLQAIHGELDAIGIQDTAIPQAVSDGGRWQNLMARLGGHRASFIKALVEFGPSTASQIRAATGITRMGTIYTTAHQLMKLGVVVKNGENYALKQ